MKKRKLFIFLLVIFQIISIVYAYSKRPKKRLQFAPFWPSIKADITRIYGRFSPILLLRALLQGNPFRALFTMRLCQGVNNMPMPFNLILFFPCRILHYIAQQLAGMNMGWDCMVGPGLLINHGWGLVAGRAINDDEGGRMGSNVTVFHGVTIGMRHKITPEGRIRLYPKIEDDVWIGPHAVITGGVVIGRGSRIAPGTVVTGDVEPYSIVGGNPMVVIRTNALPDILHPADVSWYDHHH